MKTITEEEHKYLMEYFEYLDKVKEEDEAYYKATGNICISDPILTDRFWDIFERSIDELLSYNDYECD